MNSAFQPPRDGKWVSAFRLSNTNGKTVCECLASGILLADSKVKMQFELAATWSQPTFIQLIVNSHSDFVIFNCTVNIALVITYYYCYYSAFGVSVIVRSRSGWVADQPWKRRIFAAKSFQKVLQFYTGNWGTRCWRCLCCTFGSMSVKWLSDCRAGSEPLYWEEELWRVFSCWTSVRLV